MVFSTKLIIDQMVIEPPYNHVHHALSLRYLEQARIKFLEEIGHASASYIERNLFLVISALEIKYLREVLAGEISVTCEDPTVVGRVIKMQQRLINSRGKTCIRALVECMFMDGNTRRAVTPPASFVEALTRITHQ